MPSFAEILGRMLDRIPDTLDKRQGSIIYDALAPAAAELAQMYIEIEIFLEQSSLLTATGINLDNWATNFALMRNEATFAIRIAEMEDTLGNPIDILVGSRFSTPNVNGAVTFILIEHLTVGRSLLQCEVAGTVGNEYLGTLLPLTPINNLATATMVGTQIPAENQETDEELRQRIIDKISLKAFGGNVADYREFTNDIEGVGDLKIFPFWDGGGTVKLSILDSQYNKASPEFIDYVQTQIDPIVNSGEGLGIAPIGHHVTVTTPLEIPINISANVTLQEGFTIAQIEGPAKIALENYIYSLRKEWANARTTFIFIARITNALINVDGINNVTNITINNKNEDLELTQSPNLQQIPILGGVTLV